MQTLGNSDKYKRMVLLKLFITLVKKYCVVCLVNLVKKNIILQHKYLDSCSLSLNNFSWFQVFNDVIY